MKDVYWRPQGTPVLAFVLVALLSVVGLILVERLLTEKARPHLAEKIAASKLALTAMEMVKRERLERGIPVDRETDPLESGLIGWFVSPVTSDAGDLVAKQTTINPNFAALVVQLLREARVKEGDTVAVSFTGSFPALNIAVAAAMKTLKVKPVII